ncbi:conserved hypothetical protein [Hyella patelloides LEGE 07179]|uniref:DUF2442 domain-containing protein n=1 Tax=Hyella patelloides LEGE 07179 TaxID=945734 RepID=A0A563W370_9CYAN|nr:DUF2442 domain-containing protein [Hyella patelloides]VEP18154.1 conserved hypothetical protein [Hyella patelloides LEGE 07179]
MAELTQQQIEQQINTAIKNQEQINKTEPRAEKVLFDRDTKTLAIYFINGSIFSCPIDLIEGVSELENEIIAEVKLTPNQKGLRWETADIDLSIQGLLLGIFGTKSWMKEIASKGGKSKSERKQTASRENGKKGGRPRKNMVKQIG